MKDRYRLRRARYAAASFLSFYAVQVAYTGTALLWAVFKFRRASHDYAMPTDVGTVRVAWAIVALASLAALVWSVLRHDRRESSHLFRHAACQAGAMLSGLVMVVWSLITKTADPCVAEIGTRVLALGLGASASMLVLAAAVLHGERHGHAKTQEDPA